MEVLAGGGRRSHLASTHPVRGQSNIYPLLGRVMHMTFFSKFECHFFSGCENWRNISYRFAPKLRKVPRGWGVRYFSREMKISRGFISSDIKKCPLIGVSEGSFEADFEGAFWDSGGHASSPAQEAKQPDQHRDFPPFLSGEISCKVKISRLTVRPRPPAAGPTPAPVSSTGQALRATPPRRGMHIPRNQRSPDVEGCRAGEYPPRPSATPPRRG